MRFLFSHQFNFSSSFLCYKVDLSDEKNVLDRVSEGTNHLDKKSPDYDEQVKQNVLNIVQKVDKNQAKNVLSQNTETQKLVDAVEKESSADYMETSEDNKEASLSRIDSPKKGFLGRMKESVGSYIAAGAKYGALIMGGLGSVAGVVGVLTGAIATASYSLPILAIAALAFLIGGVAGAINGLFNGALLGAIVGLISKGIEKQKTQK